MTTTCEIDNEANRWKAIYERIVQSPFYEEGVKYGKPRRGHEEGTVAKHIEELENNLEYLNHSLSLPYDLYWKLMVLIHVHDTFKGVAKRDSPILDPENHASLAKKFLEDFTDDQDMLNITQFHDLSYAVYKKMKATGRFDEAKLQHGLKQIKDLDLLLLFSIIDGCTASKGREKIIWFVEEVNRLYPETTIKVKHIIPGPMLVGDTW